MAARVERLEEVARTFAGRRLGVVGDLIADAYLLARPLRLSREAPVLVARHEKERMVPGGAANGAMNLAALGARVRVVGALGRDEMGDRIRERFLEAGIETSGLATFQEGPTVTKTRVLLGGEGRTPQQLVRLDRDRSPGLDPGEEAAILAAVDAADAEVEGWLVSDYGYGLAAGTVARRLLAAARAGKVVVVDSRHRLRGFPGVDALCPNREEAEELVGHPLPEREDLVAGGREILATLRPRALFLTLGNQGMALFVAGREPAFLPVVGPEEVTDVSGAGDTVAATILLSRCAGADPMDSAWLATCAASVVVQKLGAATASPEELARALALAGNTLERQRLAEEEGV